MLISIISSLFFPPAVLQRRSKIVPSESCIGAIKLAGQLAAAAFLLYDAFQFLKRSDAVRRSSEKISAATKINAGTAAAQVFFTVLYFTPPLLELTAFTLNVSFKKKTNDRFKKIKFLYGVLKSGKMVCGA